MSDTAHSKKQPKRFIASYARIAQDIEAKILSRELVPGAFLPGMRTMAKEYGVALGTVQQAISILVAEGALRSDGWRGAMVADPSTQHTEIPKPDFTVASRNGNGHNNLTATVGVIAPIPDYRTATPEEMKENWSITMLRGLERALGAEDGITVRFENLQNPDGTLKPLEDSMKVLTAEGVDALAVVFIADVAEIDAGLAHIDSINVPTIFASANVQAGTVPYVSYDGSVAGYDAARHLLGRGYNRLMFVAPFEEVWIEERVVGVRQALVRAGQSEDSLQFLSGVANARVVSHVDVGYSLARPYLESHDIRGMGIIMANDNTAYGFLQAAAEVGLTAGVDYGIVGFDDQSRSRDLGLTTLAPPLEVVGAETGRLVIRMLNGDHSSMQVRLRSHLIPRASTRPARVTPTAQYRSTTNGHMPTASV